MNLTEIKHLLSDPIERNKLSVGKLQELYEILRESLTKAGKTRRWDSPAAMAYDWSRKQQGRYTWDRAKHLDLLNEWIVSLETGKRDNIMISMPPRHGKSELLSFWYPVWLITHNPLLQIMFITYGGEFAAQWGARVRNFIQEFGDEFGVEIRTDTASRTRWELTSGGGMYAVGTGGQITGRGADRLIVDDPVKGDEAARSQLQRDQMLQWWQQTAYTRLEPGGKIAMVGTRWHQEDLLGKLEQLSEAKVGAQWDIMKLPALSTSDTDPLGRKEGEALWPERWPREKLLQIKDGQISDPLNPTGSPYAWSALYQQSPTPEEGASIKRVWWKYYQSPPADLDDIILSWDLAFKDLAASDFVVGQCWGRKGAQFYLLDMTRGRMNFPETLEAFRNMADKWPQARRKLVEDSANAPALIATLHREIPGIVPIKPKGSKDARLSAVAPAIESGNVYIPEFKTAKWVVDLVEECATFPNAAHDDTVDALSQALNYFMPSGHRFSIGSVAQAKLDAEKPKTTEDMITKAFHEGMRRNVNKEMRRRERMRPRMERMRFRI